MMHGEVILLAMALGALVALIVSWPFWMWRMDREQDRTIKNLNEQFDAIEGERDRD